MFKLLLTALSFLTIMPLRLKVDENKIRKSVVFFPFIGFIEGLLCFAVAYFLIKIFSAAVVSVLCIFVIFVVRGIFHIDGLSDTADALFFKGTGDSVKDKEQRLEIMKQSTVGAGGVTAVVLDVLFKFVLIKELIELNNFFMPFTVTFCLSRWILIPLMYHGKPARQTGLGALFIGKVGLKQLIFSSLLPVALIGYFTVKDSVIFLPLLIISGYCCAIFAKEFFEKKFNGLTGDHLGALVEVSEIILLFIFVCLEGSFG